MIITSSYHYIPVSNLQQSRDWYTEHLGFRTVKEDPLFLELQTASGVRIMLISNGGNITSHMNYPSGTQAAYGFTVSDIDLVYQEFINKGIKVGKITEYAGKSFGFHDPDGNIIEVWSDYPERVVWNQK